jgi:hypothetical protein
MKTLTSAISTAASRMMIVCAVLGMGSLAWAQVEDEGACSDQTLRGDYGDLVSDGVLIGTPGLPQEAQVRTVGVYHFMSVSSEETPASTMVFRLSTLAALWTSVAGWQKIFGCP